MQLLLELENPQKLQLLLEFLQDLKYVNYVKVLNIEDAVQPPSSLSKEEALKIVQKGCEMSSFGNPVNFQRDARKDRTLPFRKD